MNKLIVILGPTAAGKTSLSVKLAQKFNGEIISADSRQVYKSMDIGTAKATKKEMAGVPHHLLGIVDPDQGFTLAQYKKQAIKIIKDIQQKGKLPFLVGGTGLYIQAITDNLSIPEVKPDQKLRADLETKTNQELHDQLKKLDPQALEVIDINNKRRMIRALEVCLKTGQKFSDKKKLGPELFDTLQIGLKIDADTLEQKIKQRTQAMIDQGLVDEVKKLLKKYDANLPSMSGIGYKEIVDYLNKKISLAKAVELISLHTLQYSKRQMTWFKRPARSASPSDAGGDKSTKWVKSYQHAEKLVQDFIS